MDNQQVFERVRTAWVAGIIDGEGCISVYPPKPKTTSIMCNIAVGNSDPVIIATLAEIYKDWKIGHYINTHKTKHLPSVRVDVRGFKRCQPLLIRIIPYLVSKRQEAELLLKLINYRFALNDDANPSTKILGEFEAKCLARIKELKHVRHLRDFVPDPFYCKGEDKVHTSNESIG